MAGGVPALPTLNRDRRQRAEGATHSNKQSRSKQPQTLPRKGRGKRKVGIGRRGTTRGTNEEGRWNWKEGGGEMKEGATREIVEDRGHREGSSEDK